MAKASSIKQSKISKEVTIPGHHSKPRKARVSKAILDKMRQARYLISLLCLLVTADAIISNFIIQSGFGMEGNPLIHSIVGQTGFVFLKLSAALYCSIILWKVFSKRRRLGLVIIILFVMLYTAILWWNLSIWFMGQHNV